MRVDAINVMRTKSVNESGFRCDGIGTTEMYDAMLMFGELQYDIEKNRLRTAMTERLDDRENLHGSCRDASVSTSAGFSPSALCSTASYSRTIRFTS
jgi:hypothetical protein